MEFYYFSWRYLNLDFVAAARECGEIHDIRYEIVYLVSGFPNKKRVIQIGKTAVKSWCRLGGEEVEGLTFGFINAMGRALEKKMQKNEQTKN